MCNKIFGYTFPSKKKNLGYTNNWSYVFYHCLPTKYTKVKNELCHTSSTVAVDYSTFLCIGFGHGVRSCWAIEWKKAVQIYIEYYLIRNSDSLHTFTYQFFLLWMENLKGNIGAWKWEKVKVIHYLFLHAWPQIIFLLLSQ